MGMGEHLFVAATRCFFEDFVLLGFARMKRFSYFRDSRFPVCEILLAIGLLACSVPGAAANERSNSSVPKLIVAKTGAEGRAVTLKVAGGGVYFWDLDGDGQFERRASRVSKVYEDSGTYTVKYRRAKKNARFATKVRSSGTSTRKVRVQNVAPTASISPSSYQSETGVAVTLSGSASDPSPADQEAGFTFRWRFGDGTEASGYNLANPSHMYSAPGTYQVKLRVVDQDGGVSAAASATVVVVASSASAPPTATPTSTPVAPTATPTPQPTPTSTPGSVATVKVNPTELVGQIIENPGMGWQSCDKVNTSGQDAQGFKNKVAYIKYYWKDLEPSEGNYYWTVFDQRVTQARNSGQKVAFRIVVVDNLVSAPSWLRDAGASGTYFSYYGDGTRWTPHFDDPIFRQKHFNFLQALGQRYNGHPDIDSVDIGTVGLWGEWHFGETTPSVPMPSTAGKELIIDKYFQYFPDTPLVAQLEDEHALEYAVQRGAGFRGDCLGNMNWQNRISPPGMYEQRIAGANAGEAWRTAPVQFEACWTIQYWVNQGWDVNYIFNWALSKHMSAFHNKNSPVPSSALPAVNAMLLRIGYRYVLHEIQHELYAQSGGMLNLSMSWENKGVAPSYGNYVLGVQLRNAQGAVVGTIATSTQVKNWMPGTFALDQAITLPSGLAPGEYTVAIGIIDPVSQQPKVQLASAGKDSNGWYPYTSVIVQ